jgi:hypothetical protein
MKEVKTIDLVYLFIHKRLLDKSKRGYISKKEIKFYLSSTYHIPKVYCEAVIKELITLNLIKKDKSEMFFVKPSKIDLGNTSEIFRKVGLFSFF